MGFGHMYFLLRFPSLRYFFSTASFDRRSRTTDSLEVLSSSLQILDVDHVLPSIRI